MLLKRNRVIDFVLPAPWIILLLVAAMFGPEQRCEAQNGSLLHAPIPQGMQNYVSPNRISATRGQVLQPAPVSVTAGQAIPGDNAPLVGQSRLPIQSQPPLQSQPPIQSQPTAPYQRPVIGQPDPPPVTVQGVSWTYQPAPPVRVFRIHDIVTIRVDEITRVLAEGAAESRKRTLYEAILSDWIRLTNFRLRPDPQGNGDPTVATESNSNYRAESTVESRESMTFNIAARVVDIRPNGSLVLEATKMIRVNDNLWETSLTGICRAQDIAPDNVVLSKDLIDLEIRKEDRGHLRDSYKRGWFQRWFDRVQPF